MLEFIAVLMVVMWLLAIVSSRRIHSPSTRFGDRNRTDPVIQGRSVL
jgi:hypothetical protein